MISFVIADKYPQHLKHLSVMFFLFPGGIGVIHQNIYEYIYSGGIGVIHQNIYEYIYY